MCVCVYILYSYNKTPPSVGNEVPDGLYSLPFNMLLSYAKIAGANDLDDFTRVYNRNVHIKFHTEIGTAEPLPDDLRRIPDQFKFFEEWNVVDNFYASISPSVEMNTLDALCRDLDTTPVCHRKLDENRKGIVQHVRSVGCSVTL